MSDTKLILLEGLPGSGKSTAAQYISRCLTGAGISNKWWYEEEKGHPVYVFDSEKSMQQTVEDLTNGRYDQVIHRALLQWKKFSEALQSSDSIVVVDGCLLGYLTWSLFPLDVPLETIADYVAEVERIIAPCHPCLIYLQQEDVHASFIHICKRRGGSTEERFVSNAVNSPYGKIRRLSGFEGMVSFWKDFRVFADDCFARFSLHKLAVDHSGGGDWQYSLRRILDFLGVPVAVKPNISREKLLSYTGTYQDQEIECSVRLEKNNLILDGIPSIWPNTPLMAIDHASFEVESLPIGITFTPGWTIMDGPELLEGKTTRKLRKIREGEAEITIFKRGV